MGQDSVDLYRKELTDGGNVYVEMQAGLSTDQEDLSIPRPGAVPQLYRVWIPFRNLSGLTRATPELLLYAQRAGSGFDVELSSTHAIDSAKIRILSRGKIVSKSPLIWIPEPCGRERSRRTRRSPSPSRLWMAEAAF